MVNACANPSCRKSLRYLRDGIVYLFATGKSATPAAAPSREHFWLCGDCAEHWMLKVDSKHQVQMMPKQKRKQSLPATPESHPHPLASWSKSA